MRLAVLCGITLTLYFLLRLGARGIAAISGGRFKAYRLLASRYHGEYESRGMYDPPTVSFHHHDSLVRVGLAPVTPGQPPNPRTRVVSRFKEGMPFRLELAPVTRPAPPQEPRGTRPVKLGIPFLDREFNVRTNDPGMAREFLNPKVQAAISDLMGMAHPGGMLVSITPERQLVQVDRNLGLHVDWLDRAVSNALILHDSLSIGVCMQITAGIDIMEAQTPVAADVGPPICKVCGEPIIVGPVLVCSSCQTPHHRECWQYVGTCSIYGCSGKTAVPE